MKRTRTALLMAAGAMAIVPLFAQADAQDHGWRRGVQQDDPRRADVRVAGNGPSGERPRPPQAQPAPAPQQAPAPPPPARVDGPRRADRGGRPDDRRAAWPDNRAQHGNAPQQLDRGNPAPGQQSGVQYRQDRGQWTRGGGQWNRNDGQPGADRRDPRNYRNDGGRGYDAGNRPADGVRGDGQWTHDHRDDGDHRNDGGYRNGGDRRWGNGDEQRRGRRWDGNDDRRDRFGRDGHRPNLNWRNDQRYDWRGWRDSHRQVFQRGRYDAPHGFGYRSIYRGFFLEPFFYSSNYWLADPYEYRLPPVQWPYRWVRYYDDAVLVDTTTGEVVDVIQGFFF